MSPNHEAVKHARKRKLKELFETPMPARPSTGQMCLPFHMPPTYPSTALRLDINSQHNPKATNDVTFLSPSRNFQSFTALLTADDSSDSLSTTIKDNTEQINHAIAIHGERLKHTLSDLHDTHYIALLVDAKEKSAKKLKEKEREIHQMAFKIIELEEKAEHSRKEIKRWKNHAKQIESKCSYLDSSWQDYMTRRGSIQAAGCSEPVRQEEEVEESSHVDPDRVEPDKITCRVCGKQGETMMLWQCRHLCVCKSCDVTTKICPVCLKTKKTNQCSIEVILE